MKELSNDISGNQQKHETLVCKRCLKLFECKVGDVVNCQCTSIEIKPETSQFLTRTEWGCLCVNCLREMDEIIQSLKNEVFPKPIEMKEGFHYYIEKGLWVFTEQYHILRGHCCKNACRHCPYGFKK